MVGASTRGMRIDVARLVDIPADLLDFLMLSECRSAQSGSLRGGLGEFWVKSMSFPRMRLPSPGGVLTRCRRIWGVL